MQACKQMAGSSARSLELAQDCDSLLKKCESLVIRKEIIFYDIIVKIMGDI
jgi:hypothetical protein